MAVATPLCDFGWTAPDFNLPDPEGRRWRLGQIAGARGVLIMFICNHCPYVQAVADRIARDARDLRALGIGVAAIMSNDVAAYPDDSPENMIAFASRHNFDFPYLYDHSQQVARAYGAVCTPDFFGFDAGLGLQYRGRLDSSGKQPAAADTRRDLFAAMAQVAAGASGPVEQMPSMGCSIKWREGQ